VVEVEAAVGVIERERHGYAIQIDVQVGIYAVAHR
jgi:hypothetical protein